MAAYLKVMTQNHDASPEALAERARSLASDAGREFLERANTEGARGFTAVGRSMDDAARYVRSHGVQAAERFEIDPGHVDGVANSIEGAAEYMQTSDPKRLFSDVDRAVQRHPYRALAIGAAVGYVVGRLFSRD